MTASTITTSTFLLKDASNASVAGEVTLQLVDERRDADAVERAAVYGVDVHAHGQGRRRRRKDLAGQRARDGRELVVHDRGVAAADPRRRLDVESVLASYLAEILRNEGLNAFTTIDVAFVSPALLSQFDVVVLGDMPLTPRQVSTLTGWVNGGGNLVAMRPDKQLASLLGLRRRTGRRSNALPEGRHAARARARASSASTIQFHGTADRYTLNGATAVATLYSDATTATANPAVTLRSVGSSGGQAAAFTFDLARSVVYTRQGNPAWAGQERDGVAGIRPDDMFYGAKAGDVQPDWVDTSKIAIPQADEQQRLLVNLITVWSATSCRCRTSGTCRAARRPRS